MTRKFRITIGGVTYNVEVEEIGAGHTAAPPAAVAPARTSAPVSAPPRATESAPAPVPAPAPLPAPTPVAGGEAVRAPLPGMVVAVKVELGQKVNVGDVVLVLEAMKMENDITAPVAGTVQQVLVEKGRAVALSDVLVVIG